MNELYAMQIISQSCWGKKTKQKTEGVTYGITVEKEGQNTD